MSKHGSGSNPNFAGGEAKQFTGDQSTPQKIITEATDWRFLNELKRQLRG